MLLAKLASKSVTLAGPKRRSAVSACVKYGGSALLLIEHRFASVLMSVL